MPSLLLTVLVDSASYAAWLFLASLGLTLIFGVLKLLNVAHGGLYSFGAYAAAFTVGLCLRAGLGVGVQLAAMLIAAIAVAFVISLLIERLVLARMYGQHETLVLLSTYAVFLILEDSTKLIWGGVSLYANAPRDALAAVQIGTLPFPVYDLLLIIIAVVAAVLTNSILTRSRIETTPTILR